MRMRLGSSLRAGARKEVAFNYASSPGSHPGVTFPVTATANATATFGAGPPPAAAAAAAAAMGNSVGLTGWQAGTGSWYTLGYKYLFDSIWPARTSQLPGENQFRAPPA